jgi:hypothetical protein
MPSPTGSPPKIPPLLPSTALAAGAPQLPPAVEPVAPTPQPPLQSHHSQEFAAHQGGGAMQAQLQQMQAQMAAMQTQLTEQAQAHKVEMLELKISQKDDTIALQQATISQLQMRSGAGPAVPRSTGAALVDLVGKAGSAVKTAAQNANAPAPTSGATSAAGLTGSATLGRAATTFRGVMRQARQEMKGMGSTAPATSAPAITAAPTPSGAVLAIEAAPAEVPSEHGSSSSLVHTTDWSTPPPASAPQWGATDCQQLLRGTPPQAAHWLARERHKLEQRIEHKLMTDLQAFKNDQPKLVRLGQHCAYLASLEKDATSLDHFKRQMTGQVKPKMAQQYVDAVRAAALELCDDAPHTAVLDLPHPGKNLNFEQNYLATWHPIVTFVHQATGKLIDTERAREIVTDIKDRFPLRAVATTAPVLDARWKATAQQSFLNIDHTKAANWLDMQRDGLDQWIAHEIHTKPQRFEANPSKLLRLGQRASRMAAQAQADRAKSPGQAMTTEAADAHVGAVFDASLEFHNDTPGLPAFETHTQANEEREFLSTWGPLRTMLARNGADNSPDACKRWVDSIHPPRTQRAAAPSAPLAQPTVTPSPTSAPWDDVDPFALRPASGLPPPNKDIHTKDPFA